MLFTSAVTRTSAPFGSRWAKAFAAACTISVSPSILKLAIFTPREEVIVEGGRALVSGAGWVDLDVPLTVEILDRSGNRLGGAQVPLDAPAVGQLGTFSVEVDYQTPYPQWARITVAEVHPDLPGVFHYTSVLVWLRP